MFARVGLIAGDVESVDTRSLLLWDRFAELGAGRDLAAALRLLAQLEAARRLGLSASRCLEIGRGHRPDVDAAIASARDTDVAARRQGRDLVLCGEQRFVINASGSSRVLVRCRSPGDPPAGARWVAVPRDAGGLMLRPANVPCFPSVSIAHISFDDCRVSADFTLAAVENDVALAERRHLAAAATISALDSVVTAVIDFAGSRSFQGKTLVDLQVVRHRIADLCANVEILRASIDCSRKAFGDGEPDAEHAVARHVLLLTARASSIVASCAQLFGGRGYLLDNPAAELLRQTMALGLLTIPPTATRELAATAIAGARW